jgi:hypothetical protein
MEVANFHTSLAKLYADYTQVFGIFLDDFNFSIFNPTHIRPGKLVPFKEVLVRLGRYVGEQYKQSYGLFTPRGMLCLFIIKAWPSIVQYFSEKMPEDLLITCFRVLQHDDAEDKMARRQKLEELKRE